MYTSFQKRTDQDNGELLGSNVRRGYYKGQLEEFLQRDRTVLYPNFRKLHVLKFIEI